MPKLKIASYWAAGCGGCDVSILDVHEKILDIAAAADVVFWPIAVDTKYADVEAMPDKHIDVTFFNGAIGSSENEHMAHLLRKKSKVLIAYGSCAHLGGIPGLANLFNRQQIFKQVYHDSPSTTNENKTEPQVITKVPEGELTLPEFYNTVRTLNQVVDVDYYFPGCPPLPKHVMEAVKLIVENKLPPKGSVICASNKIQCDDCPRERKDKKIPAIKRVATSQPDPKACLMDQGYICMGLVTRAGCDSRCQKSGVPCRGCYGPPDGVTDQGAKMIAAMASIIDAGTAEEAKAVMAQVEDPVRTFNRFSIPASPLHRRSL